MSSGVPSDFSIAVGTPRVSQPCNGEMHAILYRRGPNKYFVRDIFRNDTGQREQRTHGEINDNADNNTRCREYLILRPVK